MFRDSVEGRAPLPAPPPPWGLQLIDTDVEQGTIELAFEAIEDWTNPTGNVLGAFQTAMLYDTIGPALLAGALDHAPVGFETGDVESVLAGQPDRQVPGPATIDSTRLAGKLTAIAHGPAALTEEPKTSGRALRTRAPI